MIVARFAEINSADTTFTIVGGDIKTMRFEVFPAVIPVLYLAVKILLGPGDFDRRHELRLRMLDDQDQVVHDILEGQLDSPAPPAPLKFNHISSVFVMANLILPTSGSYHIKMYINGVEAKSVRLKVEAPSEIPEVIPAGAAFEVGMVTTSSTSDPEVS
jgi:hypothetical protein